MGPRWTQEGSESPEEAQDGAKMGPRWVREPRTGPGWAQDGPKKGSRWALNGSKISLKGFLKKEAEKGQPWVNLGSPFWGPLGAHVGPLGALVGSCLRISSAS